MRGQKLEGLFQLVFCDKNLFFPSFTMFFLPLITNKNVLNGFLRRRGGDVCSMLNRPETLLETWNISARSSQP